MQSTASIVALSLMLSSTVNASVTQTVLNSYQEILNALNSGGSVSFSLQGSSDCLVDKLGGSSERLLNDIRIFDIRTIAIENEDGLYMEYTIKNSTQKTHHEVHLSPPTIPSELFSETDVIQIEVYKHSNQEQDPEIQNYTCSLTKNGGNGYVKFTKTNP